MNFFDKVVVITGGANGIGKCLTEEFAKCGAKVVVIDIDPKPVDCDLYYVGDIAQENTLHDFAKQVLQKYGQIDYLINNACINRKGILSCCSYEEFSYVQKVGVMAPYMLVQLFLNNFNEGAAIVNISSTRAYMSQPDTESYAATKGAISALTHALAISLSGKVRVNSISPGWIDTTAGQWSKEDCRQHPVQRIGTPADIAKMVMFLCSEDSGFITGEDVIIDGGMSRQMIYHEEHGWKYST